jgi:hypothetical protein
LVLWTKKKSTWGGVAPTTSGPIQVRFKRVLTHASVFLSGNEHK